MTPTVAAANRFYTASCANDLAVRKLLNSGPSNMHGARLAAAAAAAAADKALVALLEQLSGSQTIGGIHATPGKSPVVVKAGSGQLGPASVAEREVCCG